MTETLDIAKYSGIGQFGRAYRYLNQINIISRGSRGLITPRSLTRSSMSFSASSLGRNSKRYSTLSAAPMALSEIAITSHLISLYGASKPKKGVFLIEVAASGIAPL